jgi:hypothetical protein
LDGFVINIAVPESMRYTLTAKSIGIHKEKHLTCTSSE